jgi:hypothetical protein
LILSEGLGLINAGYRAEFDLTGLLRMDSQTQITVLATAVDKGLLTHNEARRLLGYGPEDGGNILFAQQQMIPLAAASRSATQLPSPSPQAQAPTQPAQINQRALIDALRREIGRAV